MNDSKEYTEKLRLLFKKRNDDWTRNDTLEAFDYLNGLFHEFEFKYDDLDKGELVYGLRKLSDILYGFSQNGNNGVQWEFKSAIIGFCRRLKILQ